MQAKQILYVFLFLACVVACEPQAGSSMQAFVVQSGDATYRVELRREKHAQNAAQGRHLRVSCVLNGDQQKPIEVTTNYSPDSDLKLDISDFRGHGNGRLTGKFDDQTMFVFAPCARAKWISQRSDWRLAETGDSLKASKRDFGDIRFCGAETVSVTVLSSTSDSSKSSVLFVTKDAGTSWSVEPISALHGCQ